jgi:preprotein translocase subunit SecF
MNIIGRRKIWFAISLALILPGIVSLLLQGLNLGLDFSKGYLFNYNNFPASVNEKVIKEELVKLGVENPEIKKGNTNNEWFIKTKLVSEVKAAEIQDTLKNKLKGNRRSSNFIGPAIGEELLQNALLAVFVASLAMLVYITFRFELLFGIAALIALFHDTFVVLGVFSIFQIEINSAFVAAILTILGYSINDTIVIFDRIRENLAKKKKDQSFEDMVNDSVLQTMTRSINTVLTVVFTLVALLIFGGESIRTFILALLIGVISGAYSSIFNASPLWVEFKNWQAKRKTRPSLAK